MGRRRIRAIWPKDWRRSPSLGRGGDLDAASKLAVPAAAAARKAKNAELSKSLARQQVGWKEAARSAENLRADQAALAANPDDPAANLSVGKHYCRLDDWAGALPLLAKAADENLQRLAADELKASADPRERLARGRRLVRVRQCPAAQGAVAISEPCRRALSAGRAGSERSAAHQSPKTDRRDRGGWRVAIR